MFGRELIRERVQNLKKIVGAVFALGGPEHQPGERARAGRAMFLDMGHSNCLIKGVQCKLRVSSFLLNTHERDLVHDTLNDPGGGFTLPPGAGAVPGGRGGRGRGTCSFLTAVIEL